MQSYVREGTGRLIVINLERGDLLLESITGELDRLGIKDAVITSAIGSLQKAEIHRVTGFEPEPVDEFLTIEAPMELSSLQGYVLDGQAHFHTVISDLEQTYTGHLEPGTTVLYLVEISMLEMKNVDLKRIRDENNIVKLAPR
jgi:predicted DNA-binding protein with PD1-like motif